MRRQTTLGLPLGDPRGAWLAAAAVLVVYALSMQRGLGSFDSPELALVARTLGLGHPPGQPLHTLLGFLFSHLPGVPPLLGLNFMSALCGALAVLPMACLSEWLLSRDGEPGARARRFGYGAVALGALHGALWEPATRIEVYPLATLCALWAVAWTSTRTGGRASTSTSTRTRTSTSTSTSTSGQGWVMLVAGVALGLSASANPMIASLTALAMVPGLVAQLLRRQLGIGQLALAVLGGVIGLLPYGYVFMVAGRDDVLVWGRPVDAASLHHYFSFADYAQNIRLTQGELVAHFFEWLGWTASQGILPIFLGAVAAFAWLGRGRGLGAGLGLGSVLWTGLFIASNVVWKLDNPDFHAYLGVPLGLGVAGLGALVGRLVERPGRAPLALGAVLALTVVAPTPLPLRVRHLDRFTDTLAGQTLAELPPGAILISETDHLGAALLYLQLAEGARPDVVHLAYGLGSSSWFWELTWRMHPTLRPVELRGAGGKAGRVQRLLAANPQRPVLFERSELAQTLTPGPLCVVGWSAGVGRACAATRPRSQREPAAQLAAALATLGDGAPGTAGLLAMVALQQGMNRWHAGQGAAALEALRSGVARRDLPTASPPPAAALDASPPPPPGWPSWQRPVVLGDPARNLFVCAALLHGAGDESAAHAHLEAARRLGLPEALGGSGAH